MGAERTLYVSMSGHRINAYISLGSIYIQTFVKIPKYATQSISVSVD